MYIDHAHAFDGRIQVLSISSTRGGVYVHLDPLMTGARSKGTYQVRGGNPKLTPKWGICAHPLGRDIDVH